MSFDEMWGKARSTAVARQDSSMQLNQLPADAGGGAPGPRLVVTSAVLTERAKNTDRVRDDFVDADNAAMKETDQVTASLLGFKSASAFSAFAIRWRGQMDYVKGLLEKDVAGALRASAQEFVAREIKEKQRHSSEKESLK
ncbi:hypothetical protein ACWDDN_40350 [Streptomyces griseoruber]|uniref:hypothetical protein n=1 Tax=Streptomyces griseoruber TaxID=1943 RepID=UPI0037A0CDE5